jgi:diguanylate cyclase (GGDEF)-like protein
MAGPIRRSIGRKLLVAAGAPALVVGSLAVLWLRHETRRLAPGFDPVYGVAVVALVVLAVAMALLHLAATHVLVERPLRRLAAGMRQAREGDFLHRVAVESEDELGTVAQTYNETLAAITDLHVRRIEDAASIAAMQRELALKAELERHVRELTILSETARTLAATLDVDELVRAVAARASAAIGDAEVEVLLTGDAPDELVVRATSAGTAEGAGGMRMRADDARPGWTVAPMTRGDERVGAIAVRRPGAGLAEDEVRVLEAIAGQAAVAIANAHLHGRMVKLSRTDPLTGFPNRRSLFARLEVELERSERFEHATAVLIVDVDHFERYGESVGHSAGDALLREVATILSAAVRRVDLVARYRGEEFAVVLARADRAAAAAGAEKLRAAVAAAAIPNAAAPSGRVTISIGTAVYPDDAREIGALVDCADAAMFAAKRAGRDTVRAHEQGMRTAPGRKRDASTTADAEAAGANAPDAGAEAEARAEETAAAGAARGRA